MRFYFDIVTENIYLLTEDSMNIAGILISFVLLGILINFVAEKNYTLLASLSVAIFGNVNQKIKKESLL
jgi:hypothetical protein